MYNRFVYTILCASYFSIIEGQCQDDFDTHERETSQSNVAQQINDDMSGLHDNSSDSNDLAKDCQKEYFPGFIKGAMQGGIHGAIEGGASAVTNCMAGVARAHNDDLNSGN